MTIIIRNKIDRKTSTKGPIFARYRRMVHTEAIRPPISPRVRETDVNTGGMTLKLSFKDFFFIFPPLLLKN